jgi:hypothetical protein
VRVTALFVQQKFLKNGMPGVHLAVRSALQAARVSDQQQQQQQGHQLWRQLALLLLTTFAWVSFLMWCAVTGVLLVFYGCVSIVVGVLLGPPIYIYQQCTNCFTAFCYVVLQIMWVLASALLWGAVTHREWVANRMDMPVAVFAAAVGIASLLFTSLKFCYDVLKDQKLNLWSIACWNATFTLVVEGLWVVFDTILTVITDGLFGASLVSWAVCGKWPWEIAKEAERLHRLQV